jgi:hypothetical protein
MPRLSALPVSTTLAAADTFLIHQASSSLDKRVTGTLLAEFMSANIPGQQPSWVSTIAALKAISVSGISNGTMKVVSGYYAAGGSGGGSFFYDSSSVLTDNGGTVIQPTAGVGRWIRPTNSTFNVTQFGATGNGSADDTAFIQSATNAAVATVNSTVYFPAGKYVISSAITATEPIANNISFTGDGANVSIITQTGAGANAITLTFSNDGVSQPSRPSILNLGFSTTVFANEAIKITYGAPVSTSTHLNDGPRIDGVCVNGGVGNTGFLRGVVIESGWDTKISNSTFSGRVPASFVDLVGAGIKFNRSCNNSHVDNVQINFFDNGIHLHPVDVGVGDPNTEGMFLSNCSMVAVKTGLMANVNLTATAPYISSIRWTGGMVELRSANAGFELNGVRLSSITGVLVIPETVSGTAVKMNGCEDITVSDNTFSSMSFGVTTTGTCSGINVTNNIHTGGNAQVTFGAGTTLSRSGMNVQRLGTIQEIDNGTTNRIYVGCGYSGSLRLLYNHVVANADESAIPWTNAVDNGAANLTAAYFRNPSGPIDEQRFYVPPTVNFVRLTAGARWEENATGSRIIKIKANTGQNFAVSSCPATSGLYIEGDGSQSACTGIINVKQLGISYFELIAGQSSGGDLYVKLASDVAGTFFDMEILG